MRRIGAILGRVWGVGVVGRRGFFIDRPETMVDLRSNCDGVVQNTAVVVKGSDVPVLLLALYGGILA